MTTPLVQRLLDEAKIWPRSDISGLLKEAAEALTAKEAEGALHGAGARGGK